MEHISLNRMMVEKLPFRLVTFHLPLEEKFRKTIESVMTVTAAHCFYDDVWVVVLMKILFVSQKKICGH